MSPSFVPLQDPPSFQRWAAAQWRRPNDSTIYGAVELDMTRPLALIERLRHEWGIRLTLTHLVTKALALAIAKYPRTNVKVRFWGKLEQRQSVDVIVLVAGEGGRDLSAHRITGADLLPLRELATQVIEASERIRRDEDPQFRQSRELVTRMPWWLMRPFLSLASLCMNELHLDLSKLGLPVDLFGVGMVTSALQCDVRLTASAARPCAPGRRILAGARPARRSWPGARYRRSSSCPCAASP